MAATIKPKAGDTIKVRIPGRSRAFEYVVVDDDLQLPDAVRVARPSRKHPGDFYGGFWVVLLDWIVQRDGQ